MAYELVYTSAPSGLTRGSSGFCVVACTQGLGPRLMVTLEGLSAYKPLYPHYAPNAWDNPISRSHYLYEANGELQHILSRTCFNGVDHTRRSNKLASHLVLNQREADIASGGPASLLLREELFKDAQWEIKAEYFPAQKTIPATFTSYAKCETWENVMGDAGWGGYLAQLYTDSPNKNVYIVYRPEQNGIMLSLLHEAISLLPENLRWKVTFNTYFVNLPAGMSCSWRCCPVDSEALRTARRSPSNVIIDITKPQKLDHSGDLITLARTGKKEETVFADTAKADDAYEAENSSFKLPVSRQEELQSQPVFQSQNVEKCPKHDSKVLSSGKKQNGHCDQNVEIQPRSRRPLILISMIVLGVAILSGGVFYAVASVKNKQLYAEQKSRLQDLVNALSSVQTQRAQVARKKSSLQTERDAANLILEVDDLRPVVESIRREAEELKKYQNLFDAYETSNGSIIEGDNSPQDLIDSCDREDKNLEKTLKELKKIKQDIVTRSIKDAEAQAKKKQEKKALEKKPVKPEKKAPEKKPIESEKNVVPAEKTEKNKKKAKKKPEKKVSEKKPAAPLPMDDVRYLWQKAPELYKLEQNGSVEILVGDSAQADWTIEIISQTNGSQKIGSELVYVDNITCDNVQFCTTFVSGKISIIQKSVKCPEADTRFLLRRKSECYPLFFRIGISKIKINGSPQKGNLVISFGKGKIEVKIPANIMLVPDKYFDKNNELCDPVIEIRVGKKHYVLKKDGGSYKAKINATDHSEIRKKIAALNKIEKEMNESTKEFVDVIPVNQLKDEVKKYKECEKKRNDAEYKYKRIEEKVNNKDKLKNIAKDLDLKEELKKHQLEDFLNKVEEKLKGLKKKKSEKVKSTHKDWLNESCKMKKAKENLDKAEQNFSKSKKELLDAMKKSIPLKDFNNDKYKYSDSLKDELDKAEQDLKNYEKGWRDKIEKGSLLLSYNESRDEQFDIEKLIK